MLYNLLSIVTVTGGSNTSQWDKFAAKLAALVSSFAKGGETLSFTFSKPTAWYAVIVGSLVALCAALLGVILVLKRFSFIGDGLSHVAFGAMAVAGIVGFTSQNNIYLIMPLTVIAAVLLLRMSANAKVKGDAALAMLSVGALGIGYLLMNVFPSSGNTAGDACNTLFGGYKILTLTKDSMIVCSVISALVILFFIFFYNRIFSVTFDEGFATATGTKAGAYNMMIAVVTAVIISLAMNLVGSLLISALVIFPAMSAMRLFKGFRRVVICSAVISVVCVISGLLLSIVINSNAGPTVVLVDVIVFGICSLAGKIISH